MADPSKAVFLSYASQDAEAAKRICEALRAAGVEVWFDAEGGLEHGDEWDAKIRRQIKECVLFIAVISANTEAREEGYFRIEWDLAAERARGIASGVAFILPVVIDGTRDADALVPDRFRAVQWTKLPGGVMPPEVLQRFLKLWSHRTGAMKQADVEAGRSRPAEPRGEGAPPADQSRPRWLPRVIGGVVVAAIALAIARPWSTPVPPSPAAPSLTPQAPPPSSAPLTEAGRLIERAWVVFEKVDDASNDEWDLAEEMSGQATKLEPRNAEAWAVHASVTVMPHVFGHDRSPARLGRATKAAQLAVNLDPQSVDARAALANCYRLGDASLQAEAERIIRALAAEQPRNKRVQRIAGNVLRTVGKIDDSIAAFDRAMALPGGDPYSRFGKERGLRLTGRFVEGEALVDEALARDPGPAALLRKLYYVSVVHDDLDRAAELLRQVPTQFLLREQGASQAISIWLWRRDAERCLTLLRQYPGETVFGTLKGAYIGMAYQMSGRGEAARIEWQSALKQVETRLAVQPNDLAMLNHKTILLALLGDRAGAGATWRAYEELLPVRSGDDYFNQTFVLTGLGRLEEAITALETSVAQADNAMDLMNRRMDIRHDPFLDPLRAQPRFQALLEKLNRRQIGTIPGSGQPGPADRGPGATPPADQKSVAVLAFANLSDDKANEYFSDGISEELLNVLARVPGLKVSARTSAFYFKGKEVPVPEIAKQLGVAYVVEGSVRKAGNQVRINAQLIKAADGFNVWSDTFTRDLKDIFAVQDEIAGLIAKNLSLKLGGAARPAPSIKPEAFELYVQARRAWNLRSAAGFAQAEELLTRALLLEPDFARAHVALADVWTLRAIANGVIDTFGQRDAPIFAQITGEIHKALALDPDSSEARASWGLIVRLRQWDLAAAERELRRAIELNSNYATAHHWLGNCLFESGRVDEGLAELRRAAELDPFSLRILESYAQGLVYAGLGGEALGVLGRAEALQAGSPLTLFLKAEALLRLGRRADAIATARELGAADRPELLARAGEKAEAEAALGEAEGWARYQLLAALGRTREALANLRAEDFPSTEVGNWLLDPRLDPFRRDPHFVELLATLGLTEAHARLQAWRAAHPPAKP